ncbi:hypothetical protein [Cyanothece sp. BG0011]|uniref:hypothetical protein n=1 Tax=Cyanothece sp. BG0011 TaxID=2082950 RepID=UPI000D1ECC97|nr:hypothetical protein [Cyanothece sp. BG0011]
MIKLKYRKIIFLMLIAMLAGGSMAAYSHSEVNFFIKTIQLIMFQQFTTIIIYFLCFGEDLFSHR